MPAMVVISANDHAKHRVLVDQVHSIVSNRTKRAEEQYLVRWATEVPSRYPPLSWHSISELQRCLEHVQDYLDSRAESMNPPSHLQINDKKRKASVSDEDIERPRPPSPVHSNLEQDGRTHSTSSTPPLASAVSSAPTTVIDVYNGVLDFDVNGFVLCRHESGSNIIEIDVERVPTPEMRRTARFSRVDTALTYIRHAYIRRLARVPGKPIHLINLVDASTPSLRFRYISEYVLDGHQGVYRASSETQQGCTQCSPHMGRSIGCEYTKKCDCLEYAAVDESRITDPNTMKEYQRVLAEGGPTLGFPKKFPYFAEGTKKEKTGCLVPFYLNSRRPIYECNDKCHCGVNCRNKNVQFGRRVEVEIFRTSSGRGWGLRCREDLHEGQFIDTYRGEVITDAEATRRENAGSKAKSSYLYSLDKFKESENISEKDIFVVDGEFMGGPTKFINHSCDPNCRQYTVSYNKHDPRVYDIAFFACRFIAAGEELTFDYLDRDEDAQMDEPSDDAIPCLCGAVKCRKWLWT